MSGIIVLAVAYVISHFYRSFLAVLSPQLTQELNLGPAVLSDALGAWFATFAISQLLVGVLLDRVGPRWTTVSLFAVCGAGGGALFAIAQSGTMVFAAMILLGVGCAPILMASVYLFKLRYDGRQFATLTSTFMAIGLLGNILGSSPLAWATEAYGWRAVMAGLAVITLILALLIAVLVKDPARSETVSTQKGSYLEILKMRELWFILPLIFVNYGVVGGLRGLWAGPYLDIVHGLGVAEIGSIIFFMAVAMVVGSFAYGPADRVFNSRKWVAFCGSCVTFVCLGYWAFNPILPPVTLAILLVAIGFFSLCYAVLMAHATANIPQHMAGRGVTLVNFFNMGGVGVLQWTSSQVYREQENPEIPVAGFEGVLWLYFILFVIALAIYAFSRDVRPDATSDRSAKAKAAS